MGILSQPFCSYCGAEHPLQANFCRVCGQNISQTVPIQSSTSTGLLSSSRSNLLLKQRYAIVSPLGSGGFGEIYKACDIEFGNRYVAVKELSQSGLSHQEIIKASQSFKNEAFLLASLTHPNLPSIYDHFSENGRWYLVMSFIEGENLEAYLARAQKGRLPVEKVIQIGMQLASVLSYLHTRKPPIIFRDLKPSNVMRIPDGQLYLIDFGIARHFKQGKLKDTIALGSPGYAAPEQYGHAQTSPQTDVYSLGAVLHELLSGDSPSLHPFAPTPLHLPNYPELNNLIMCMLEKDAKKRPASMANIKRELQRILMGRTQRLVTQKPASSYPLPQSYPIVGQVKQTIQRWSTPFRELK